MKKVLFLIASIFVLVNNSDGQNKQLNVEEVWQNYLNTIGDIELLKNYKTYSTCSKIRVNDNEFQSKSFTKAPDKFYQELWSNDTIFMKTIYNSGKGFVFLDGKKIEMTEEEIISSQLSCKIVIEIFFKEWAYEIKLAKDKVIDGISYYNIEVNTGKELIKYLIDKKSFKLFQIIRENSIVEVFESAIFQGVNMVTKLKVISEYGTTFIEYTNYEFNTEINDEIFDIKVSN